jgi:hypothetical protein
MTKNRFIEPPPDSFESEDQARVFWDAHSTMDYQEFLESSDDTIEISERVFEVGSHVFKKVRSAGDRLKPGRYVVLSGRADRLAESINDWLGID